MSIKRLIVRIINKLRLKYTKHENQLVRESCEIALSYIDYWAN